MYHNQIILGCQLAPLVRTLSMILLVALDIKGKFENAYYNVKQFEN